MLARVKEEHLVKVGERRNGLRDCSPGAAGGGDVVSTVSASSGGGGLGVRQMTTYATPHASTG